MCDFLCHFGEFPDKLHEEDMQNMLRKVEMTFKRLSSDLHCGVFCISKDICQQNAQFLPVRLPTGQIALHP